MGLHDHSFTNGNAHMLTIGKGLEDEIRTIEQRQAFDYRGEAAKDLDAAVSARNTAAEGVEAAHRAIKAADGNLAAREKQLADAEQKLGWARRAVMRVHGFDVDDEDV
jgi:uncharacterized protein (DUF3084 family)